MMMVAERCQRSGLTFAAVHDSFWTHPRDAPKLNQFIREAFVELHEQPILSELYEDTKVHLGGELPKPVPDRGDLDLSVVLNSTYMFA